MRKTTLLLAALGLSLWTVMPAALMAARSVTLTVDHLIAGDNITLDKTDHTVTINASGGGGGCDETGGTDNIACGSDASATGEGSVVLGHGSSDNGGEHNIVIGKDQTLPSGTTHTFSVGTNLDPITEVYIGHGKNASFHAGYDGSVDEGNGLTISASNAGSQNRSGGNIKIAGGKGTGTGNGGVVSIAVAPKGSTSGTSHNPLVDRARFESRIKSLTDEVPNAILAFVLNNDGEAASGKVIYEIRCDDDEELQILSGEVMFAALFTAPSTVTSNASTPTEVLVATSESTLTTSWDLAFSSFPQNHMLLRVTPNTSLSNNPCDIQFTWIGFAQGLVRPTFNF